MSLGSRSIYRVHRTTDALERTDRVVLAAHAGAGDADDLGRDRLEHRPEVLARLDQQVAMGGRVEAELGVEVDVDRLDRVGAHQHDRRACDGPTVQALSYRK